MAEGVSPSLRILCLHDAHSNAASLERTLSRLRGPVAAQPRNRTCLRQQPSPLYSSDGTCVWWESDNDDDNQQHVGLDASLLHIRQVLQSAPCFCGILAVGHGAPLASLLPFLDHEHQLEFAVFIHGHALLSENERLVDEDWPVLYICGTMMLSTKGFAGPFLHDLISRDSLLPCMIDLESEPSRRLVEQFGGEVHECMAQVVGTAELNASGKVIEFLSLCFSFLLEARLLYIHPF